MALCEKILIAGFSGAGKSAFLKEIEKQAPEGWVRFDDLDQLILKNRGKKHKDLASLIEEIGWDQFRLAERQELESWLKEEGKGVLALGGGTLSPLIWELYGKSRKIRFCHLQVSFETCWVRLVNAEEVRPLVLKGKTEFENIYHERMKIFEQISWSVSNESGSIENRAEFFWEELFKIN